MQTSLSPSPLLRLPLTPFPPLLSPYRSDVSLPSPYGVPLPSPYGVPFPYQYGVPFPYPYGASLPYPYVCSFPTGMVCPFPTRTAHPFPTRMVYGRPLSASSPTRSHSGTDSCSLPISLLLLWARPAGRSKEG